MSRVVSSTDPVYGYLAGATVTATTANGSLPVAYMDGTGAILAMATTDGTGRFIIRNIPAGTLVTVTATAPNYTNFQVKQYAVNANTVSQGRISGVLTTSVDSQAPSVPTGLNAQAVNSNQINVSWNTASDNVGVVGYKVYRNGVLVSQPSGANNTFWSNYSLFPSVAYSYTVSACDAANNCSLQSPSVSATTPNAATSGPVTITGSITYSGTRTGRVFVSIPTNSGTLGTSVAWPAGTTTVPYTIRGVPSSNTSNTISAFMDILDNGTQSASSPAGSSASGATATTRDLTLINPTLAAPATPTYVEVKPGPTSVFIMWQPNRVNGVVDADYYDVYWNTSASVSPTNASGSKLGVTAGMDSPLVINSLTNGTSYYFVVVPRAGALTGSASTAVGPVIVGAATGLNTVSGTVTYNGTIPANAALYVAVVPGGNNKGMGNLFYTKYPNPSASQPFNISGIPDGGYQVYVILDMNNDGLFASGDISNTNSELAPTIVLAGNSGASGITIPLVSKNSEVVISTDHRKNVTNGDSYNVDGSITRQLKRPVAVTLTAVPASSTLSVPMDMGFGSDNGKGLQFWTGNSTRPTIGDLYTFTIKYSDNTEDVGVTGAVTGVLDNFPVNQSLLNPVSTIPTFNWMAPATAPTGNYQYSLWVGSSNTNNNNKLWEAWNIPSTQLSIIYGSGDSSSPILAIGTNYAWNIGVRDQKGNRATIDGLTFSPTITGVSDTTAPTIISTTPANNATGVSINTSISVTFSEIVKGMPELTAAVKNNTTSLYISGTGTESVDRKTQKFTPSTPLTPGTTYSIQFAAVTDLAGNPLPVTTLTFTTAAATPLDTNPPVTTASLAGGVYYTTQSVTLTPSETAKVYFTTDDSTPTTSSTQFSGPISITSTTTLKFYSVDTAGNSEQIINSIQYVIVPSGDINGDGKIDLADAQRMLGIAVGRIQATAADLKNADVAPLINGLPAPDGTIGIGDVVVVLRRIVGSVTW
jgi:methionine-rich copper-binding protein CopC